LLLGVALGNVGQGLPVGADMNININLFQLLTPFPILVGLLTIALFTLHGIYFALNKTEGELNRTLKSFAGTAYWVFTALFVLTTLAAFLWKTHLTNNFNGFPVWYLLPVLIIGMLYALPKHLKKEQYKLCFTYSFIITILLMIIFAVGIFPEFVPSTIAKEYGLNIYNSASSATTHLVMLIIALIGMPFVVGYTIWANKVFRGKVKIDESSY
jgi:cytochrome d ubiquinol oxidase subunit II